MLFAHVICATEDSSISAAAERHESARQQFKTEDSDELYDYIPPMIEETTQKVEKQNGECKSYMYMYLYSFGSAKPTLNS